MAYMDPKAAFCNGASAFQLNPQATFDVRPSYIDPCVISTDVLDLILDLLIFFFSIEKNDSFGYI